MAKVRFTCSTCEDTLEESLSRIKIVHCETTDTYDFAVHCSECGRITVQELPEPERMALEKYNCQTIKWKMPDLRPKSCLPPFLEKDVEEFIELLNSTDKIVELVEAV